MTTAEMAEMAEPVVAMTDSPVWPRHTYAQRAQVRLPVSWDEYVGQGITDVEHPWDHITVTDEGLNHVQITVPANNESNSKMIWFYIDKTRIAQLAKILVVWS